MKAVYLSIFLSFLFVSAAAAAPALEQSCSSAHSSSYLGSGPVVAATAYLDKDGKLVREYITQECRYVPNSEFMALFTSLESMVKKQNAAISRQEDTLAKQGEMLTKQSDLFTKQGDLLKYLAFLLGDGKKE